ncbi:hypothetical protein Ahy_A02g007729 [Arachis hypogaea]|uniref:SET domain-containing protein n=1 Tax=Arachis hypogaea TaxID=3818 RepID=A0A445ED09_ARAHY|nr:hypothetical protein Ahy_A02g007729 [Arachis hypogaea]
MKITFSSTVTSFYKTPYPSLTPLLTDSHRFAPNPSSSAPFAPSPPFPKLHHTPSLIFPFDVDNFRYLLHVIFCCCSLKLVSVVAAASTSSSHRRWFSDRYGKLFVNELPSFFSSLFLSYDSSSVEDYFLYIDDLKNPDKEEAEKITQPNLYALGEDYFVYCQGTAFFPLQSCMNHSCGPHAKAFKRDEIRFNMYVDWRMAMVAWAVKPCHFIGGLIQAKSAKGFSGDYAAFDFELVALPSESFANIRL